MYFCRRVRKIKSREVLTSTIIRTIPCIIFFDKAALQASIVKAAIVGSIYEMKFILFGVDHDSCCCCHCGGVGGGLWGDGDGRWRNSLCTCKGISCDSFGHGSWECSEGSCDRDRGLLTLLAKSLWTRQRKTCCWSRKYVGDRIGGSSLHHNNSRTKNASRQSAGHWKIRASAFAYLEMVMEECFLGLILWILP